MKGYVDADTSVLFHVDDPDLTPIRISLPAPPNIKLIDGYGLPIEKQRFKRIEIPIKLQRLEKICLEKLEQRRAKNKNFVITLYKLQDLYWDTLENEREYYADEIEFIKKMWWHRLYGYWFYNRGKPTYITGWHFMYLNFWHMPVVKGGYPEYRDRDRKEFIFHQYAYTTTETFKYLGKDGYAISEDDGSYKMKDMGKRVCYGLGQPKNRRSGNTNKGLNNILEICTRTIGSDGGGIMSYTGDNSEKHFRNKLIPAWNKLPLFFRPISTSGNNPQSLQFNVADSDFRHSGLQTGVTYASTSSSKFYDGQQLMAALMDEEGKCFCINTLVRMYDGSVKSIQDIIVGDRLMGDDSTPRKVLKTTKGRGKCYMIHPNKGEPWGCNDEHILCLNVSYDRAIKGCKKGDKIDINVLEYLHLPEYSKKGVNLYRVGVDYKNRCVELDPYILGLWLGDGSHRTPTIVITDREIGDYVKQFASICGLKIRKNGKNNISWHFSSINRIIKNEFLFALRNLNLLMNKHIPDQYMINSRKIRLQLLAGLIDSDGTASQIPNMRYLIEQKREHLARQIQELASSLGFYASVFDRMAKMKREDGSVYECISYVVSIYGNDLWEIPCKVGRKKYCKRKLHKNTRDPQKTGFFVEDIGEQDYYGVVIDGNRRFLLADYTVTHNTTEVDVDERWGTIKNTLSLGDGAVIHGYAYHPSTVEDYSSGGAAYKKMMQKSCFYQRIGVSGQTPSGLFRLFMPADEGLEGFIDSHGYSVREQLKDYQEKEGFHQTATEYLQGIRDHYLSLGTPEAMMDYRTQQKLFPLKWADCWLGDTGEIGFDIEIIDKRIIELQRKKVTVTGNFQWVGDIFGNDVYWEADADGRFEVSRLFEERANQRMEGSYFDPIDEVEKYTWTPTDPSFATAGADPFKFKTKTEKKMAYQKYGMSDGGFLVLWEYDARIDGDKPRSQWETDRIICTYRFRANSDDEYCEDILKASIWYGCMVYPEMNLATVYKKFREWGYAGYLKHDIFPDGRIKEEPGFHMLSGTKQESFNLARSYISYHGHKIDHLDLLLECKNIENLEDLTQYDLLASFLGALLGSRSKFSKVMKQINESNIDISGILEQFRY